MSLFTDREHAQMSAAIAALSMDAVQQANSGHPGMPMGMADAATVLWGDFLKFDPQDTTWHDRDRFVLSAGHGSMLIYALLHLTGHSDMTMDEIRNFRQLGSLTPGHPEYGHTPGVETTTGPLGQGVANAVGMAIAEAHLRAKYGAELVDHFTYVIAGDGCLMEGISQEALALAGHLRLNKLIVLWDDNEITIDGAVNLSDSTDQQKRFEASGWHTIAVDGHDQKAVHAAITKARDSDKPTMIACRTTIGKGAPTKAGTSKAHGAPLGAEEILGARDALDWDHPPFEVPQHIYDLWAKATRRGSEARADWNGRAKKNETFLATLSDPSAGEDWAKALSNFAKEMAQEQPSLATRASSGKALAVITQQLETMIGGSADLEGSNKTRTPALGNDIQAGDYAGRYINYGVREHAMAAAMNGMALHGGIVPYSGTFLVFADYCRPSLRLAALMGLKVIHVMTHDSIGVGEDGPTHQPVEHVASLRAIPGLHVYRPCDAVEVAECWELAIKRDGPSVLALTRQGLPPIRTDAGKNESGAGGYILREADGEADIVLIGTGSEVHLAVKAAEHLAAENIHARVISMPCLDHYMESGQDLIGERPAVVVEAGIRQGWDAIIGRKGGFVGMDSFGESAPGAALFEHFNITSEAVASEAKRVLGR